MSQKLPIARANLAGQQRMVIYSQPLADYSGLPLSLLIEELKGSQLREGIDYTYNAKKEDFALSLASAQALLLLYMDWGQADTLSAWHTWHAITDYIQGLNHDRTKPNTKPKS